MRNNTRGWNLLTASVFRFRIQIRVWLALFVFAPISGLAESDDKIALAAAQRFASEFAIAQAGGADLSKIRGVRTAIEELSKGIPGSGQHAALIFHVDDIPTQVAKRASNYLAYDRNILRYRPPINYTAAWTTGKISRKSTLSGSSLSRLLAERTAESFARVYSAARAAAAPIHLATDVESAMKLLEQGVNGQGAHANTKFHVTTSKANVRFIAKKLLRFEDGHLHYVKNADKLSADQIREKMADNRPAQLAQQIVALYNSAQSVGANFKNTQTPTDIIDALRIGVRANSQLGTQRFRISTDASESDWRTCAAYLRFRNGTLSYAPPSQ